MLSVSRRKIYFAYSLSFLAGYIDAVGYISLSGYFVSFMSGNTTRLAIAISKYNLLPSLLPGYFIALFVLGVIAGSIIGHFIQKRRMVAVLGLIACGLLASYILEPFSLLVASGLLAASMGAANTVFEKDGEVHIGVTYMTGTLVKLGQRIASIFWGESKRAWMRYAGLWLSLLIGGVCGAFIYHWVTYAVMLPAIVLAGILTLIASVVEV